MYNSAPSLLLRDKLAALIKEWEKEGVPSKYLFEFITSDLIEWKQANDISSGLWDISPTMITATLDDFIRQGIEVVERFANFAGMKVIPLGVMQPPETIVEERFKHRPSILGLTVLRTFAFENLI